MNTSANHDRQYRSVSDQFGPFVAAQFIAVPADDRNRVYALLTRIGASSDRVLARLRNRVDAGYDGWALDQACQCIMYTVIAETTHRTAVAS